MRKKSSNGRKRWEFWKRDKASVIANLGIPILVGGCGKEAEKYPAKEVLVREPSLHQMWEQMRILVRTVGVVTSEHVSWVMAVVNNPKAFRMEDLLKFEPVLRGIEEVMADVIDEDAEFVRYGMGPGQAGEIIKAYITVVGWEKLRDLFLSIKGEVTEFRKAAESRDEGLPEDGEPGSISEMYSPTSSK